MSDGTINRIILCSDTYDGNALIPADPKGTQFIEISTGRDLHRLYRATCAPRRTWVVMRTDRWQYDERVVDALRELALNPVVELVDPTGLLGGSQYGVERRSLHTEPAPFGKGAAGAAKRAAVKVPRRSASGNGNDRAWR